MEVKFFSYSDEEYKNRDYQDCFIIEINGVRKFSVHDGEPEDANLRRDFNDCLNIPDLMKMAYEAGKNGESFDLSYHKIEE